MIYGMLGKPRTGKSYECVVSHIIPTLVKDKRKIVTNLPLQVEHFVKVYGEQIRDLIHIVDGDFHSYGGERPFSQVDHYLKWKDWQNEDGQRVYFFIDECHLPLPSQGSNKEVVEFYSMHGHYGFDIMLITQNFRKVNRDIKDMVDVSYRTIKKTALGQEKKYILKVSDSPTTSSRDVIATHERTYEKRYFPFYKSHTMSDIAVNEANGKDIQVWWQHWTIKASVVFFIFGTFVIVKQLNKDDKIPKQTITTNKTDTQPKQQSTTQIQNSTKKEVLNHRQTEYMNLVNQSKKYHPYYKVNLSISGYAEYTDLGRRTKTHWLSANQNGQHVFTLKTSDLMLAGYEVRVLTECSIQISYYDFKDFLTCDAPTQSTNLSGDTLAMSN